MGQALNAHETVVADHGTAHGVALILRQRINLPRPVSERRVKLIPLGHVGRFHRYQMKDDKGRVVGSPVWTRDWRPEECPSWERPAESLLTIHGKDAVACGSFPGPDADLQSFLSYWAMRVIQDGLEGQAIGLALPPLVACDEAVRS